MAAASKTLLFPLEYDGGKKNNLQIQFLVIDINEKKDTVLESL